MRGVKPFSMRPAVFFPFLLLLFLAAPANARPESGPFRAKADEAFNRVSTFLDVPYRPDGALDVSGRWTLFAHPEKTLSSPGLNCSGFVLAASRLLLNKDITLEQAKRDRRGDSGPGAARGRDWDFGRDLILNIVEGAPARIVPPAKPAGPSERSAPPPLKSAPGERRGFALADAAAWEAVLPQLTSGNLYLASISKPVSRTPYTLLHYHVGLLLPDGRGRVWWMHATRDDGVHAMDLADPEGMARFRSEFIGKRPGRKKILLVETPLPHLP